MTPTSVSQGVHDARHDGRHRSRRARSCAGDRKPSSEMQMHLVVYRQRPDVGAVVHAHPPIATGFAVAGIPLDRAVLAEVVTTLGSIPIAEYGTPSTRELADTVAPYVKAHDGMLLANHGALALGADLFARVLQDGDDRALRAHQPGGAPARPRASAVARGGRSAAGPARHVRHRRRPRRSVPIRADGDALGPVRARLSGAVLAPASGSCADTSVGRRRPRHGRYGRRDSANIRAN